MTCQLLLGAQSHLQCILHFPLDGKESPRFNGQSCRQGMVLRNYKA